MRPRSRDIRRARRDAERRQWDHLSEPAERCPDTIDLVAFLDRQEAAARMESTHDQH